LAVAREGIVPTYQYACTECGGQFEAVQKFSDDPLTVHEACGGKLRKVFSPVGIVFKGSGFYRTDSRGTSSTASPSADAGSSAGSSSAPDAKPAAQDSKSSSGSSSSSGGDKSGGGDKSSSSSGSAGKSTEKVA
jgi:putative FmdB family regulatory protein